MSYGGSPLTPQQRAHLNQGLAATSLMCGSTPTGRRSSRHAANAQAYTAGHHIAFAPGRYSPGSYEGRWLLAHELAHVVQQAGHGAGTVQRKGDVTRHDWTVVTEITVEAGATGDGRAQGVDAFGQVIPIDVEVNKLALDIGRYTIHLRLQKSPEGDGSDWDTATRVYQGESKSSAHLVYILPEHVKVAAIYTLVIAPRSRTPTRYGARSRHCPSRSRPS